jgi:hypothetical protein
MFPNAWTERLQTLLTPLSESLSTSWTELATLKQVVQLIADADDEERAFFWIAWAAGSRLDPESSSVRRDEVLAAIESGELGFQDRQKEREVLKALLFISYFTGLDKEQVQEEVEAWNLFRVANQCAARARAVVQAHIAERTLTSLKEFRLAVSMQDCRSLLEQEHH